MATKVAIVKKKDPFAVVGEAMVAAADAVRKSTSDARQAASQAVPAVRSAVAQGVYITTYYTAFGIVFSALAVSALTPMNNAFGYGIRDGASAARDARTRSNGRRVAARETSRKPRTRTRQTSKSTAVETES